MALDFVHQKRRTSFIYRAVFSGPLRRVRLIENTRWSATTYLGQCLLGRRTASIIVGLLRWDWVSGGLQTTFVCFRQRVERYVTITVSIVIDVTLLDRHVRNMWCHRRLTWMFIFVFSVTHIGDLRSMLLTNRASNPIARHRFLALDLREVISRHLLRKLAVLWRHPSLLLRRLACGRVELRIRKVVLAGMIRNCHLHRVVILLGDFVSDIQRRC